MNRVIGGGKAAVRSTKHVYIGRGSVWGNPFRIGPDGTREEVIAKYRARFYSLENLQCLAKVELAGKTLVCHCKPLACHGDVLAEYLAQFEPKQGVLL